MQIYKNRELCSGCFNCANVCPKNCITMIPDNKGFLYPNIDTNKCVNCLKCQSVCPTYCEKSDGVTPKLYAYSAEKKDVLMECSSGGAFGLLADKVLSGGGYICGAVWTEDFKVKHIVTDSGNMVRKMYGSKYLQSELGDCFVDIESLLDRGKQVLFSGTPCQVLALKNFLKKEYSSLLTVDFICHSIPSPKIFQQYVKILEEKNGTLKDFTFRDKSYGWENYSLKAVFDKKTQIYPHKGNIYMELFLDGIIHRDCCSKCVVKTTTGYVSDITLADFWRVNELEPRAYNADGVSAILVNTKKGSTALKDVKIIESDFESFIGANTAFNTPVSPSKKADCFWKLFDKYGLSVAGKRIYRKSLIIRLKTSLKTLLKKIRCKGDCNRET